MEVYVAILFNLGQTAERHKLSNLTLRQLQVLDLIIQYSNEEKSRTVRHVASAMGVSKPVITRAANRLSMSKLLRRIRCESDKRLVYLEVTDDGRKIYDTLVQSLH